jgi:parallel beta-helix repeat protein
MQGRGRRRTAEVILVALALLVLVAGGCARSTRSGGPTRTTTTGNTTSVSGATTRTVPRTAPPRGGGAALAARAGAAALGTTDYPIPATGAYFVGASGSDSGPGTVDAPWRTLAYAVAAAPSGSTIVLRGGIYNESVTVEGKRLTIQNYPHEAVTLRGSKPVTTWSSEDFNSTTVWTARWTYSFPRQRQNLVQASAPLANAPDELFYDDQQLAQVGAATDVQGRTFYVDTARRKLVIGVDPSGHAVDASYLTTALSFENASGSILRGIEIDRYATPLNLFAPLHIASSGVDVENVISRDNAAAGITVQAPGVLLAHDSFIGNAQLGVHGYQADGLVVDATLIRGNNSERFDPSTEAGGLKISTSSGVTVRNSEADHNVGIGLWFDLGVTDATIIRNRADANSVVGIQYEISSGGVIAGNIATANGGPGVRVIESNGVAVWNNTLYRNLDGIDLLDGPRHQTLQNVTIRNNVFFDARPGSTALLLVNDLTHSHTAAQMNITADADAYCRPTANVPPNAAVWAEFPAPQLYRSVASFTQGTAQEPRGVACDGARAAAMFVNAPARDFALGAHSPARDAGLPLAGSVAAALGLTPGARVDLGAGGV